MSAEKESVLKIAKFLEKKTSIKEKEKIIQIAQAVDDFAEFILQSYLKDKVKAKNESHNIL